MKKTKDHNIDEKNDTKNPNAENEHPQPIVIEEWFNIHTMKYHPATKRFIEQEAQKLKDWAILDDSLRLSDFYDGRGYNPETFYAWSHRFPEMKAAHDFALRRIGSRRENGALNRSFDSSTVHKTLGHYDYVFQQQMDRVHEIKARITAQESESKVVIIERFPSQSEDTMTVPESHYLRTPEQIAGNIHRNTATQREVKVNMKSVNNLDYNDRY
jgi:hypothetical protein